MFELRCRAEELSIGRGWVQGRVTAWGKPSSLLPTCRDHGVGKWQAMGLGDLCLFPCVHSLRTLYLVVVTILRDKKIQTNEIQINM